MNMHAIAALVILLQLVASSLHGEEKIHVVTKYSEIADAGLKFKYSGNKTGTILLEQINAQRALPPWMEAFYVLPPGSLSGQPLYVFDPTAPNRVSAYFTWVEVKEEFVFLVGPVLKQGEMFQGKKYIAIAASDLLRWSRGSEEVKDKPK